MKDALGRPLQIGDDVLELWVSSSSVCINEAEVIGFTPARVRIKWKNSSYETLKAPHNVMVITAQQESNKTEYPEEFL